MPPLTSAGQGWAKMGDENELLLIKKMICNECKKCNSEDAMILQLLHGKEWSKCYATISS